MLFALFKLTHLANIYALAITEEVYILSQSNWEIFINWFLIYQFLENVGGPAHLMLKSYCLYNPVSHFSLLAEWLA